MSDRDHYIEKAKARIEQWNAEIAKMKARADEAEADAKIDFRRQLDEMRAERDKAEARLTELRDASDKAWDDVKSGFEKAWDDISAAFDSARTRYQ
ncbi:coiled coil domain-containing protein [Nisaea sp.]|uniref:coiled coil domain-containing protein n=1 Tax=Nisaea sp. TaxID=2024842 RepID=UPI003B528014